ncbi:MAG: ubiquitin family protein [Dehalococcoidales bacterium]
MSIEMNIPPVLQALVNGINRIDVSGGTIGECIKEMVVKNPALKPKLFDKRGNLPKGINIFLNGVSAYPEPLTKPVHDGDKIHISHIVLGG